MQPLSQAVSVVQVSVQQPPASHALTLVAVLHEEQAGLELVAGTCHISLLDLIAQPGHLHSVWA